MSARRADLLICLGLTLLIALVFGRTLGHDFVGYDDPIYVTDNPIVQEGLTRQGVRWAFEDSMVSASWTPLTFLSHMLDVQLFGMQPGMHHLTNVVLHAANSVLLYLVLLSMTERRWPGALVAAWFAVHPLHVESVAWIAERKDLLSTLFLLLCLGAYAAYARRGGVWRYLLVLLMLTLGLMSKPMLVTVPGVLLLLDYWPLKRPARFKTLVLEKVPMVMMALGMSILAVVAQRHAGAMRSLEQFPLTFRISNAIVSYMRYMLKMVWPFDLAVFYPPPDHWPVAVVVLCALLLPAITALVVMKRRSMPWLLVGWLWYLGTLLPVIGLVQVGRQAMADRYSYIPHIGLFVMIAWTAAEFAAREQQARKMVVAGAVGATIAFAVRAADQTRHWKNTTTLFDHALAVMPENPVALNQVGNARLREKDPAAAEVLYRRALELEPEYGMAHLNLGNLLARRREFDKAADHFEAALRWRADLARAHLGLAVARAGLKQYDLAEASFREALRLAPHLEEARRAWENAKKEQAATRATAATTRAFEDSSPAPIIRPSGQ